MTFRGPWLLPSIAFSLFCATSLGCRAESDSVAKGFMKHTTVGVWAGAPLGLSGRLGLAVPLDDGKFSVTAGGEVGTQGNKYFVGVRSIYAGHGVAWGGVDLAHWKLKSNPPLARADTDYVGLEAQLYVFRAGVMVPVSSRSGGSGSVRVTLGLGLGY
jgi:hypothetical protein